MFYCFKVRNFYKSALLLTLHFLCRYCCQESCHGTEVWASCILQKQSRAQLSPPGLASITFSVECSLVYCCTNLQNSWDLINEWAVMPVCPCLEWWVSNGLILSEWCSFLSCWFWVCWIWQTAYLQCCHVVDSAISFFCIAQVRKFWLLWWMAGSTADTCRVYFVVVSCLDTNTSLVPLFLEQRVWQPVLSTHNGVVPHIQTHFHIGKGTLRMLCLSWVMHFVCVDMIHRDICCE